MRHEVLDSFILSIIEERKFPQCKENTKTTKKNKSQDMNMWVQQISQKASSS